VPFVAHFAAPAQVCNWHHPEMPESPDYFRLLTCCGNTALGWAVLEPRPFALAVSFDTTKPRSRHPVSIVLHDCSFAAAPLDEIGGAHRATKGRKRNRRLVSPPGRVQQALVWQALAYQGVSRDKQRAGTQGERAALELKRDKENISMNTPPIVSRQEWEAARQQLLVKEKELTRARDALAAERRRMPWLAVEKKYEFDGPGGKTSLLDLFDDRRQLIVYRAFFEPGVSGWPDHACIGCSMVADQVAHPAHLNTRDTTLAFVSRAPQPDIARLKARMGWELIPWYAITDDFDKDFGVDEWHGTNAFIRDGDRVFRTYFINNRGDEAMGGTWAYLDITALGRQEKWEDSPEGYPQTAPYKWWIWHDQPSRTRASELRAARSQPGSNAVSLQRRA
jgi:predicted dithiol-disulfide oxidoreductase (DUF899 family)